MKIIVNPQKCPQNHSCPSIAVCPKNAITQRDIRSLPTIDDAKCIVLETVKERRNDLAHGTLSFAECGRDYSIDQLIDIKKETVLFLKGLLTGMKKYYDEQQYKL